MMRILLRRHTLRDICELHLTLSNAISLFNNVFGWQLLIYIFSIFVLLIDSPYFMYLAVTYGRSNISIYYFVDVIIWNFIYYVQLCWLVVPCGRASRAVSFDFYKILLTLDILHSLCWKFQQVIRIHFTRIHNFRQKRSIL